MELRVAFAYPFTCERLSRAIDSRPGSAAFLFREKNSYYIEDKNHLLLSKKIPMALFYQKNDNLHHAVARHVSVSVLNVNHICKHDDLEVNILQRERETLFF